MVTKGSTQLVSYSEVEETVHQANEQLKQNLIMIENLNETFIREARSVEENGFGGEFKEAFVEKTDQENDRTQSLNAENLDRIRRLSMNFDRLLINTSFQEYVYETELIPVKGRS